MGQGEEEEEKHTEEMAGSTTRIVVLKRRDGATRRAIVPFSQCMRGQRHGGMEANSFLFDRVIEFSPHPDDGRT